MSQNQSPHFESTLDSNDIAKLKSYLSSSGALLSGHFRLASGLHSDSYLQCALLLMDPVRAEWCGQQLARLVKNLKPAWILSPALGGMIIGHELARALGTPHIFAERKQGEMCIRRGFCVPEGKPFIAVEDVVTTGGSVMEAAELARAAGGRLVGICSILNRSGQESPFGEDIPFFSLLQVHFPTYKEEECPLCAQGIPIHAPGTKRAGE